jgi:hypothetical protein
VAESPPLEWPPTGAAAVQALADAVDKLEALLLTAGWKALQPGDSWYAQRFAWEPLVPAPAAEPGRPVEGPGTAAPHHPDPAGGGATGSTRPTRPSRKAGERPTRPAAQAGEWPERFGRFRPDPAWPEGTEELWRCEIKSDSAHRSSRFHAVVYQPGHRRGHAIAASGALKWGFRSGPDPNLPAHRAEMDSLTSALEATGWEGAGRGASWYSERFVWRRDGEPPDLVEPAPNEADQRS